MHTCLYHSKTLLAKNKELFCLKPGQIRQRRGIYLTQGFWICESEFDIGNLFIGELFITSERNFSNSETFVTGRKRISETGKLKINMNCEPVSDIFVWQNSRK